MFRTADTRRPPISRPTDFLTSDNLFRLIQGIFMSYRFAFLIGWVLSGVMTFALPVDAADDLPQILMIAGKPSHGYGAHEHYAGLKILEDSIGQATDKVNVRVVRGWPEDEALIDAADSIVIYCDGGARHLALAHRDKLAQKIADGCGFVCLHYAVEVPNGSAGDDWIRWLGGNFETDYSVNPHWTAEFKTIPEHPVTTGVKPCQAEDEWYFHLRFNDSKNLTPILAAVAPEETMRRKDGHHSGNPHVRKSVAAGDRQTVAWTFERPDGGRSFGFTGGHFHWNWAHESYRRLVSNAILWTTADGLIPNEKRLGEVAMNRLYENQDYPKPANFSEQKIAAEFQLKSSGSGGGGSDEQKANKPAEKDAAAVPRLLDSTALITSKTSRHRVDMATEIKGVRDLFLVVTDGGDGFRCDWADWVDPVLVGPAGTLPLVDLDWVRATSGFGKPTKNANCVGDPVQIREGPIGTTAIGVHAPSVVHFRIPEGYETFSAIVGLDLG